MNLLSWVLVGGAIAAAAFAIDAGNNLGTAVPAAAAGVILVSTVGVAELQSRSSRLVPVRRGMGRQPTPGRVESDSLLRLRRSFETGEFGRSSILATVWALERGLSPAERTSLSLEAERAVLDLPREQFRMWVDDRLQRIEAAT
ncbi:MAG: hypothetical protein WCB19_04495 [Thermoplasmata archaeon]